MSEPVTLSLKRREIPLLLEGPDGTQRPYTLREFDGTVRDAYLTKMTSKMTRGADGRPTNLKNYEGIYACLIARSLFDEDGNPVSEKEIQTWPSNAQKELFKLASELNGLTADAEELAKND